MEKLAFKIGEEFWLNFKTNRGITNYPEYRTLGGLISLILPNIFILAGIILFFLLIGGGIGVIVSAGQQNPEGAARGRKAVTAALIGFLIIFCSFWLIKIIETVTGLNIFAPGL